jgi:hypothetical protein
VFGTGTIGTAVTLTGNAVFAGGAGNYVCYGSDTTAALAVIFTYASGSSFTPTSGGTGHAVSFICIGS